MAPHHKGHRSKEGFTLVEVLVATAILMLALYGATLLLATSTYQKVSNQIQQNATTFALYETQLMQELPFVSLTSYPYLNPNYTTNYSNASNPDLTNFINTYWAPDTTTDRYRIYPIFRTGTTDPNTPGETTYAAITHTHIQTSTSTSTTLPSYTLTLTITWQVPNPNTFAPEQDAGQPDRLQRSVTIGPLLRYDSTYN